MNSFEYFMQLTKIPRPSYKEDKVRDYLLNFAQNHNLDAYTDEYKNVVIKRNNGSDKTIALQAHTDMVAEKLKDIKFDFDNESINTIIENDFIKANGTTLGGDDGSGVAIILSLLEKGNAKFPNIEAIFTTQEEVSMGGAVGLDCSDLKSNMMIGIDGTDSKEIIISCAGSSRISFDKCIHYQKNITSGYRFEIYKLHGGHSGDDIHKNRANAIKLGGEFLSRLKGVRIGQIMGGNKDNAIPRELTVTFDTDMQDVEILTIFNEFNDKVKSKFPNEKDMKIELIKQDIEMLLCENESCDIINFINEFENGILAGFNDEYELPIASINLASINITDNKLCMRAMLRYNLEKYKQIENDYLHLGCKYNFVSSIGDETPFYRTQSDSELVKVCQKAYNEVCGCNMKEINIHAGLEGGLFKDKMQNLDVVGLGVDLCDIHTPSERMSISSLLKMEEVVSKILKMLAE